MRNLLIMCAAVFALSACSSTKEKGADMADKANTAVEDAKSAAPTTSTVSEPSKATDAVAGGMKSTCKLDKDTRVIEARKTESGGCELFYTKFGEEKSVASSGFGTQYCEEVKDRIQSNLDKAGFACN